MKEKRKGGANATPNKHETKVAKSKDPCNSRIRKTEISMNPIEFLQAHGINPDSLRSDIPHGAIITDAATQRYRALTPVATGTTVPQKSPRRRHRNHLPPPADTLLNRFLIAKGWTGNGKTDYGPLVPYLLADLVMLTYEDYLKHLRHDEKHHCNAMMESYHKLNHSFFKCFATSDQDAAVTLMDTFGEYLHNDLEIFRLSIQTPLMEYPAEFRTTLSAICVCRLLCAHADLCYSTMYATHTTEDPTRLYFHAMEYHSREMFVAYTRHMSDIPLTNINLNDFPAVRNAMNRVQNMIVEFIQKYDAKLP